LETWYLAVFKKKLGKKLFYFDTTKKISLDCFLLCFGPKVHYQSQKLIFWQKKNSAQKTEDPL
jgi:hypothetical protein